MINNVVVTGYLVRYPESRMTTGGVEVATFSVAINESWKDKNTGEKKQNTCFIDVEAWKGTASFCSQYLAKGMFVCVQGKLQQDTWEERDTGKKRSKIKIRATSVYSPKQDGKESQSNNNNNYNGNSNNYNSDRNEQQQTPDFEQPLF